MTRIISVVNQKGGVGKTTTSVNIATSLAAVGKSVLLVDLDPQGNASTGFGFASEDRNINSYHVLTGTHSPQNAILETAIRKLKLIPATIDLTGAEIELVTMEHREFRLRDALHDMDGAFDYVIIDCPPSLGLLTLNALTASHAVLIPLQCEFYALEGLSHLLKTVGLVQTSLNPELSIHGVLLTMYDRRNKLTEHIENDVREYLGELVYKTVIPRNVRVSEAPSHGVPAIVYDMRCPGSQAYLKLAREVIRREKNIASAAQAAA